MKFRRTIYGGDRPITTAQPIQVIGGFNLDTEAISFDPGDVIPAGTLAVYDELTRKVKVLKTGKVKAISSTDAKIVTLEASMFLSPFFRVGDKVLKTVTGTLANAPTITKIDDSTGEYVVTISAEISGLTVGDILVQVVADITTPANAALVCSKPYAMVIENTQVKPNGDETGIDVTIDSGHGSYYARRIPPIPGDMLGEGNVTLKYNPNIKLTNSK